MTASEIDLALLLPQPQRIVRHEGAWDPAQVTGWRLAGAAESAAPLTPATDTLAEVLGKPLSRADAGGAGLVTLELGREGVAGRGSESYRLTADAAGLTLAGATPRALFWAVQTLRQLLALSGGAAVPALTIEDWPAFAFRGYSDDISRGQVSTLKDFEFIVENLARLKYNVYQPYMEDVIFVDRQPMMGIRRGRLTRDEVASLVEFGRRRSVDIMPQLNSCGHCERLLELPEYAAWRYKGNLETINPELPETRAFLSDVYHQLFDQFPCEYFHMGLDEARGLGERPDMYVKHANWLAEMVLAAGRKPIMWHDMFVPYHAHFTRYSPQWLKDLNRAIILDVWIYQASAERIAFLDRLPEYGFRALLSPCLGVGSGCCGSGTRTQWRETEGLLRAGVGRADILGVHNTVWGAPDRHLHWRGHAVSAEMLWHGPGPEAELPRVARAFARQFYGLEQREHADALTAAAEFGLAHARLTRAAATPPRALAQTATRETVQAARHARREAAVHRRALEDAQRAATRNAAHLDHVLAGLRALLAGAERVRHAPKLRDALRAGDAAAVEAILSRERPLLYARRAEAGEMWLRRAKPEGMLLADLRFDAALTEMETLAWTLGHEATRAEALLTHGFAPLDLSGAVTSAPRDLAPLPWGVGVLDNVPWRVLEPVGRKGKSLVWLRSEAFLDLPKKVSVVVGKPAKTLHVLHAVFGKDRPESPPGGYRLFFADGGVQEIRLRPMLDVADWWMPFGHLFGGGGALRIDTEHCRLAYLSGREDAQGHCLYHFWRAVDRPGQPIERIEAFAGAPDVSLLVAAITLEG